MIELPILPMIIAICFLSTTLAYHSSPRYMAKIKLVPLSAMSTAGDMSQQVKDFRNAMAKDEKAALMIDALRGKNLNDDDRQAVGVDMDVVETRSSGEEGDVLPTVYDAASVDRYFDKRPNAVITRLWQIFSKSLSLGIAVLGDLIVGRTQDFEVRRAAELRNTIVSLGPFFIKLGQALSIRPDILSPKVMVELQQLCDKVPSFDSGLAMKTIEAELGAPVDRFFTKITPEPVAAASLGQVYKATLKITGEEVAVKVQRPFVLETVSLDLYLIRKLGLFVRKFPALSSRLDIVSLLDEFAGNFYQELDYNLECRNGIRIAEDMKRLPMVRIPRNYPEYTARRVHTAEWVDGEKLSQSTADDVSALVNLGVITYLTQLLDTGFFHADPHPGNMLRSPDGRLVILDFGLMTTITDNQKYGMIEAIAHLIHRDYSEIGNDFINLDFIPQGTDTSPIVPALARVFEAALAGGGAKSLNFQELSADLAEITFKFPFRIPPYFALIIRAISVLEGIALVGNPEFAIVDEAYPYIARRLLTDESPRLRAAFKYMIYGKSSSWDVERVIDLLQALEKFVAVKDNGDGSAFKVDGMRGDVFVGKAGDSKGTKRIENERIENESGASFAASSFATSSSLTRNNNNNNDNNNVDSGKDNAGRYALKFFFSDDGVSLRDFLLDEICLTVDALSRNAVLELLRRISRPGFLSEESPRFATVTAAAATASRSLGRKNPFFASSAVASTLSSPRVSPLAPLSLLQSAMPPALLDAIEKSRSARVRRQEQFLDLVVPPLTQGEREMVDSMTKLIRFLVEGLSPTDIATAQNKGLDINTISNAASIVADYAPNMREFGLQILGRLSEKAAVRAVRATIFGAFGIDYGAERAGAASN